MSVTAASSALLASAPPPQRYAIGQDRTNHQERQQLTILKRAKELLAYEAQNGGINYTKEDGGWRLGAQKLAEEFGIALLDASSAMTSVEFDFIGLDKINWATGMRSQTQTGAPPPAPYQGFGTIEAAKSFAFQKLDELKAGIASHNAVFGNWENGGAQKLREQVWQSAFNWEKMVRPETSDVDAIKRADDMLLGYIQTREGLRGYLPGQGALQSAFQLSGPLFTENADGTLSLNKVQARYNGVLIFEIGADIGQNVDKAA
jgi:hypothetical protein